MYTKHFGFKEKPFNLVPNPSYLFLSSKHANALTFLEYGLAENAGFVMLTGEIGISKAKALDALYAFLIEKFSIGRKVLLVIDEAQNLFDEVLEEIRMLSNLQTDEEMLLQIMIVGQPELRNKISDPRLEQFAQRIAVSYHLSAMTFEETRDYSAHRIEKAGGNPGLFSTGAVEKIYEESMGIPRTINLLCDASLVYGYADEKQEIGPDTVEQVIEDKGGIGFFTRRKLNEQIPGKADSSTKADQVSLEYLIERIINVENNFAQLKEFYHAYIKEVESRAEFCRDQMVAALKNALKLERKKNQKIAIEYGRIKERYNMILSRIKKN